jgi:hypothetical protein
MTEYNKKGEYVLGDSVDSISEGELLGNQVQLLLTIVGAINLEVAIKDLADLTHELRVYEAVGIMDGNPTYFNRLEQKRARVERLQAIIRLVDVAHKTNKHFDKETPTP